jgi:hypothetical protein
MPYELRRVCNRFKSVAQQGFCAAAWEEAGECGEAGRWFLIAQKVARVGGFGTVYEAFWISKLVSGASIRMLDPPGVGVSPMFEGKHPSIRGVFFVHAQKVARGGKLGNARAA